MATVQEDGGLSPDEVRKIRAQEQVRVQVQREEKERQEREKLHRQMQLQAAEDAEARRENQKRNMKAIAFIVGCFVFLIVMLLMVKPG